MKTYFKPFWNFTFHASGTWLVVLCFLHFHALLSVAQDSHNTLCLNAVFKNGGMERADSTVKSVYLAFACGDYGESGHIVLKTLREKDVKAHFFFAGDFFRAHENFDFIHFILAEGHYIGPHSDKHLQYTHQENSEMTMLSKEEFIADLLQNYEVMAKFGISKRDAMFFLPPLGLYNKEISAWTRELGFLLVNVTSGFPSKPKCAETADSSLTNANEDLLAGLLDREKQEPKGLNGYILLVQVGPQNDPTNLSYKQLPELIDLLRSRGYSFFLLDQLKNR